MQTWNAQTYDESFGYVSQFGRELVALLKPQPGERILDLGCGTGELTAEIAALGAEPIGIDSDTRMLKQARRRHPNIRFLEADGHEFSLDAPVDAAFSNAALHWMLEPRRVLEQVRATMSHGGRFVGELGGKGNIATIRQSVLDARSSLGVDAGELVSPWYFPSPGEYSTLLEEVGFRVELIQQFDRCTPLDERSEGVIDWLEMFGDGLLQGVTADLKETIIRDSADRCRPTLYKDGRWFADYVRLRFVATVD